MKMTVDAREFLYCPSCNKMYSDPFFNKSEMPKHYFEWLSYSWDQMVKGNGCMTKFCDRREGFTRLVLTPDRGLTEVTKSTDEEL